MVVPKQVAKILTEVLGKSVEHVKVSGEESASWMKSKGIPPAMADFVASLEVQIGSTGAEGRLNTTIKDVTGKDPIGFRAFAEAAKDKWM